MVTLATFSIMASMIAINAATPSSVRRIHAAAERSGERYSAKNTNVADLRRSGVRRAPGAEDAPLMRPKWEIYYYNDNGWTQIGRCDYEYDSNGQPVSFVLDDEGDLSTTTNMASAPCCRHSRGQARIWSTRASGHMSTIR